LAVVNIFKYNPDTLSYELNTKKKWNVLYVDPPNAFKMKKTGGSFKSGSSDKYMTMTIEQICDMPVEKITEKNSIIFLWVQTALSGGNINNYGDRILEAWGFSRFSTKLYWDKGSIGMGANYRNQVEELWVAKKGDVKALHMTRQSTLVRHKRLPHSVKPDIFRRIVEDSTTQFGKKRKMIELFKRRNPNLQKEFKKKWDYFGDQLH